MCNVNSSDENQGGIKEKHGLKSLRNTDLDYKCFYKILLYSITVVTFYSVLYSDFIKPNVCIFILCNGLHMMKIIG